MLTASLAFSTPADKPRWQRWLLFSPLARIVIFMALTWAATKGLVIVLHAFGLTMKGASPVVVGWLQFALRAIPSLAAYLVLVHGIERRRPKELALRRVAPDGLTGVVAGTVLFSTVVGALWLLGSYHVTGVNAQAAWLPALLKAGLGAGIGEEIMFRGVLFRIVEEGLGTWSALVVSALFFGAVHISNPGATLWSSAAIAIEAGLLFGMIYQVSRSLPLCMGVHAAWNFAQGTIYGIPVSGMAADGWLVSARSGPDWLSGGVFGAEASVVALALCTMCTLALIGLAFRRRSIVAPAWRRRD